MKSDETEIKKVIEKLQKGEGTDLEQERKIRYFSLLENYGGKESSMGSMWSFN